MPNIFQNFKALLAPILAGRRVTFSPTHTTGGGSGGNVGFMGDLTHRGLASSGLASSAFDLDASCGDVLDNSIVAACVNAIAQALPEAPILLERRVNGVDFERIDSHPVLDLLHNPNPFLSEAELWGITTAFERTRGEAFWYFEYEAGGSVPKEIWFRAPQYVQVLSDEQRFISGYRITSESGQQVELDDCDVVHFRHQLSPYNPRAGWTPLHTGRRQIVGDNSASLYHGAILRNAGAASLIISLKDAAAAGEVTPGQLDEYVQQFKRKSSGAGAGAILGMDLPLDVHKVGFSPDEMALDKLLEYYESRVCALMGVNRRVINLGQDPTYENSRVALNDFWERTIIPMRRRHAATLSSQLLPLFGLDPSQYRLSFDFSEVEALRENVDALHTRWRETLAAGGVDLFTFQEKIGLSPDENLKGRFVKVSAAMSSESEGGDEIKAKSNNQPKFDPGEHPRGQPDNAGQFRKKGASSSTPVSGANSSGVAANSGANSGASGNSSNVTRPNKVTTRNKGAATATNVGSSSQPATAATTAPSTTAPSTAAAAATPSSRPVTGKKRQRYAEEFNEGKMAERLGGIAYRDSEPIDVGIKNKRGKFTAGIEMKTIIVGKKDSINMPSSARSKKRGWEEHHKVPLHTIVLLDREVFEANGKVNEADDITSEEYAKKHDFSKRRIFYKRGGGNLSLSTMYEVTGTDEEITKKLKKLISTKSVDQLPENAKPLESWQENEPSSFIQTKSLCEDVYDWNDVFLC